VRVTGSQNPQENGLFYTLGDQIGSTSVVADSSGNKVSETRYSPWGETRYSSGNTPTDRKYTGQREDAGIGLYYYNARWYDAKLGRFAQADTVLTGGVDGHDRYAYVKNSPMGYSDPTGHEGCGDIPFGYQARTNCSSKYNVTSGPFISNSPAEMIIALITFAGVTLDGVMTNWTLEYVQAVYDAVNDIGTRLLNVYPKLAGLSKMAAFKAVFTSVEITWGNGGQYESKTCTDAKIGMCTTALRQGEGGHINIKGAPSLWLSTYNFKLNIVHELGHVLWNEYSLVFGYEKAGGFSRDLLEPNTKPGLTMQQHPCPMNDCNSEAEIFGDMFIAWVYDAWNEPPVELVAMADDWMNHMLPFGS
jgi:RHS repeat-associated protein